MHSLRATTRSARLQFKTDSSGKQGTPSWAIALTFFLAIGAGLMIGAVAMKAYNARRQKHDEFYRSAFRTFEGLLRERAVAVPGSQIKHDILVWLRYFLNWLACASATASHGMLHAMRQR